jgi:uncharacterized protein YbjT (DUF2867 family)
MTEKWNHTRHGLTLVLGGTGKTGRRVVKRLEAHGVPTRVGSRSGQPPFDWDNQNTWEPALEDVRAAYITYYPDLAIPGAADAIREFTQMAVWLGVRRLVLLSGRGEEEAQLCEKVVQSFDVSWTIVRSSWLSQSFSEHFLRDPVLGGEVALPVGDVREPFVDADDIADVAVAALTEDGHEGQIYELTGPRLLTFADAVHEIAKATNRNVRYVEIPLEVFESALADQGFPADAVQLMTYLFTTVMDGRNEHLTDGVQRALGRSPRDFGEFARSAAAAGAWSA